MLRTRRSPFFRVVTAIAAFTLMLFVFNPTALDRPGRTLAFGVGWGVLVTTACYLFMRMVDWLAQRASK